MHSSLPVNDTAKQEPSGPPVIPDRTEASLRVCHCTAPSLRRTRQTPQRSTPFSSCSGTSAPASAPSPTINMEPRWALPGRRQRHASRRPATAAGEDRRGMRVRSGSSSPVNRPPSQSMSR